MPGPNPQQAKQAISVAEHLLEEALLALKEARKGAYGAAGGLGFTVAVAALQRAGIPHKTHEGDHDRPSGHSRVH